MKWVGGDKMGLEGGCDGVAWHVVGLGQAGAGLCASVSSCHYFKPAFLTSI